MNTEIAQKLTRARTQLLLQYPFFGTLALRLRLVEDASRQTMAVDGRSMFYNPTFIESLSPGLTRACIAHEVMHCVYEHPSRRNNRDHRRWNIAADYVINAVLTDCGFDFEDLPVLLNKAYDGMSTDQVYSLLPTNDRNLDPLDDCMDAEAETLAIDATDWKIATIQAASTAKAMGKLPGNLERFIEEISAPTVDWKAQLARFITEIGKGDYSWMRPNWRFAGQGLYLPSLYSESMGEIVIAIDTSGSIDQATLDAFGSEIKAIVATTRPRKTTVIYCDAVVNHIDEFAPNDELQFKIHGGGGTDFRPPFRHLENEGTIPVCFVYLTDMYGPFPADPGYPVLWVCTNSQVAPWGETLQI